MKYILFLASAAYALAQTPGTITQNTTVTATAGVLNCVFSNQNKPTIQITCNSAGDQTTLSMSVTPAVGVQPGAAGTFSSPLSLTSGNISNNVSWIILQPQQGTVTWQITANGTTQTGQF